MKKYNCVIRAYEGEVENDVVVLEYGFTMNSENKDTIITHLKHILKQYNTGLNIEVESI